MEKYTMFMDWNNQYCQNYYITQGNLQIQFNPYQITNGIFHGIRTQNLKICMETQKTLNIQRTLEKKWSWSYQDPRLQNIQSSYNRQNSMVLAQKIEI